MAAAASAVDWSWSSGSHRLVAGNPRSFQNYHGRFVSTKTTTRPAAQGGKEEQTVPNQQNQQQQQQQLPTEANVVIVGGGIIGTSVAYHLAKLGVENVVLLERHALTAGTTWHAAGLMNTFGSWSSTSTWMRKYSVHLYRDVLPTETGLETGFSSIGLIELACDVGRLEQYRRIAAFNRLLGVQVTEITPARVQELFPLCNVSDVLTGFYVPADGRANPTDVTQALAKGARMRGVQIFQHCPVTTVTTEQSNNGRRVATGVVLDNGHVISARTAVVNCAGMWARQFAQACGVYHVPNQAVEHYYMITDAIPDLDPHWPVVEDSSRAVYIRPEGAGLMLGFFESPGVAWNPNRNPNKTKYPADDIPHDFAFGQIQPDWDRMMPVLERAILDRVPALQNVGIATLFCGPESFTPDNLPILGESATLQHYYIAAGLNSIGILTGGGVGLLLARWIQKGHAPDDIDVTAINCNRFDKYQACNVHYRHARAGEALGTTYAVHYPDFQYQTGRNAKRSPLHDKLGTKQGAHFKCVSGWESPAWYHSPNHNTKTNDDTNQQSKETVRPKRRQLESGYSFGREAWFPYWQAEHEACRNQVALFDMSFMSKFLVQGRDAGAFLNRLSTAQVVHPIDDSAASSKITYTQWLNERGYMEADLTVTQLSSHDHDTGGAADASFCTDTMHHHVWHYMHKHILSREHVCITDMTARYAQINLQGPNSRNLLQAVTSHDVSQLQFRQVQDMDIGMTARALCMRITYVGELGYELLVPVEQAVSAYESIVQAGQAFGLRHAGLRALGSLRMEKGYRDYGHDMDNTDTLLECGLGFTCNFNKPVPFIGQEQVERQREQAKSQGGLHKRLASVLVQDPEPLMFHGEVLWRNGVRISDIRSASYGHTLHGAVGLTMLQPPKNSAGEQEQVITRDFIETGDWSVEIGNQHYPCQVSLTPFYDPKGSRIKV